MGADDGVVVVGGGAGGHAVIEAYRQHGGDGPVTLLSADDRLPYFRPALSKEVISDGSDIASLGIEPADWYRAHDVRVELDTEVTGVDPAPRILATAQGPVHYESLVIATGSRASVGSVPGAEHPDVVTLRSAADAERLLLVAAAAQRIAVVGSGFIGCEIAASLRHRGVEVVMIAAEPSPQANRLGPGVGSMLEGWLRDLDVTIFANSSASEIVCEANAAKVALADGGPVIEADAVIVATGATPNLEPWRAAGLGDGAITVDATMGTPVRGVLAVGDVARAWHPVAGRHLQVEHWGDALGMGSIAGATLAGEPRPWSDVPGFWSTVGGRTMKYVAWGDGWDRWHRRTSPEGVTFWFEHDGEVVGVLTVDHDDDLERGQQLIRRRAPIEDVGR